MKTTLGESTVSLLNHPRWSGSLKVLALLFAVGLGGWSSNSALAVPADPTPREMTQPDGTKIQVRLRGDEFFHWTETTNGYAVVKDTDRFWKYAQPATNQAEFRAIKSARVGASDPARLGVRKHDLPDAKVLRKQVQERMHIFGKGGGFVFNSIHNVQSGIPIENLLALYQSVQDYRSYPV